MTRGTDPADPGYDVKPNAAAIDRMEAGADAWDEMRAGWAVDPEPPSDGPFAGGPR